jgi:choline dehydrogenase-like flavoprotein
MLHDGNKINENKKIATKVCILGGGVAGIVLANELKDKFEDIVLIESGEENYTQEAQDLYKPSVKPPLIPDPSYSRLRFLGGSSNHWENSTSPLSPIDFEQRDWVPHSGWPISFSDIAPYYDKAAFYCGVGQDGYDTKYWAERLNKRNLAESAKHLETRIAKAAMPPVRFFNSYGELLKNSNSVHVYKNSNLTDVKFDTNTNKIEGVDIVSNSGSKFEIHADVFILCLGGIENARMLLVFNEKYNNQLGNQGDKVGRYFMEHPTPRAAHILVDKPEQFDLYKSHDLNNKHVVGFFSLSDQILEQEATTNLRIPLVPTSNFSLSDGISSSHILSESMTKGELPDNIGSHLYNVISDLDMVAEGISRKGFDYRLFEHADETAGFLCPMMMEQTPSLSNRVKLSKTKDRFGIPQILIDYEVSNEDKNRVWKSLNIVANELGANSLGRMRLLKNRGPRLWNNQLGFSNHHMGTTRMSESPESGVVDHNCQVFGTNNFFIGGSSVFSTGGHVPPTLTICALTIRLSNHITSEFSHD